MATSQVTVVAVDGVAVYVNGHQVPTGEVAVVDDDTAAAWIAAGWVTRPPRQRINTAPLRGPA